MKWNSARKVDPPAITAANKEGPAPNLSAGPGPIYFFTPEAAAAFRTPAGPRPW
ncbi:MAG: hypothetical protein K0R39_2079 [Symbiobacteriaceae bacterium]|nr:hypothetical protein [Symbiobacteriaceae bacterium]